MKRVTQFCAVAATLAAALGQVNGAHAEVPASDAAGEEAGVTPPRLAQFVDATWPPSETPRENVSVLFEFTVNADGHVEAPRVVGSAGEAFDVAATSAVLALVFEPARRGPVAVPARIRFRFDFHPPPESLAAPIASATDQSAEPKPPDAAANAERRTTPAASSSTSTDRALPQSTEPSGTNDEEPLSEESYNAVAHIAAPPREVTRRTIEREDLTKIPGTSGDAVRAIEVMPGVSRTSISSGDPILRGAAWHESRAYVEGVPVPQLFHLGGVKSAFNSRLLSRVDLYPGNYGVSYGRAVGGVISAKVRDPEQDRLHALVEASVIDSMALVETPIGKDVAVAVAARRSNIDLFYDAFAPKSSFSVAAAPVYYDYQGLGLIKLNSRHQLRLLSYGSRDTIRLVFANPSDFDPSLRDRIEASVAYHRVQASLDSELSARLKQRVQLTYGYTTMRQMFGPVRAEMGQNDIMSRGEWNYRASDSLRMNLGFDVEAMTISGYYIGARPPQAEGETMNGGMSTERLIDMSDLSRITLVRPAVYSDVEWRPIQQMLVVPGVRIDNYSDQGAWTVNPRISSRIDVVEPFSIKWGIGLYSQNPQYYELLRELGNPKLRPYHATHYSLGFEHRPHRDFSWGVEGFYKWLQNRVVSTPGGQPPAFTNDGVGRVYGSELFARYTGSRLRAWLAYTLSRSTRQDRNEPWRLFDRDQTHVLATAANYQLGRGWELGFRFRLTSGNPYTPVRASMYDARLDVYRPVNGAPFSARNPMFHQLDVRLEKQWLFSQFKLAAYLDVQNAYNASNYEGFDYSYDYAQRERIAGLPLLPNLGLRGEI